MSKELKFKPREQVWYANAKWQIVGFSGYGTGDVRYNLGSIGNNYNMLIHGISEDKLVKVDISDMIHSNIPSNNDYR